MKPTGNLEFAEDLTPGHRRLKCSEQLITNMAQTLANPEIKSLKLDIFQPGSHAVKIFEAIASYLKPHLVYSKPFNAASPQKSRWYDYDCKVVKKK